MSFWGNIIGLGLGRAKLSGRDKHAGGAESQYGRAMGINGALQLSAAWGCIRLIAETGGTLPCGVFFQNGDHKELARAHPLYRLLHDSPNADQSAAEYWEGQFASIASMGDGFSLVDRIGKDITSLIPLQPLGMQVYRDASGARRFRYSISPYDGDYSESEIFHIKGFGFGGDRGLSPISFARKTLYIAAAAEEVAGRTFESGLQLSGFIKPDKGTKAPTSDQRKELVDLFDRFAGSSKAGKVMPLDPGMEFQQLGMNPEDAQLLQTRGFNVEEICRWFRVPPFMIGHTEKTTSWGTGLEQQTIGFLTYALRPYLTRIEQAIRKQLLAPRDAGKIFAEFNLDGLLRADSAARAQLYSTYVQNGIMVRNEVRAKENLPPVEGGDVLTVQSNLVPLDQLGTQTDEQAAKAAMRTWLGVKDDKGKRENEPVSAS